MGDRVRVTVSVSPETLEAFSQMAAVGRCSLARCMGDWLDDTTGAAQTVTFQMAEVRGKSTLCSSELAAEALWEKLRLGRVPAEVRAEIGVEAPSSNTGLKSPRAGKGRGS